MAPASEDTVMLFRLFLSALFLLHGVSFASRQKKTAEELHPPLDAVLVVGSGASLQHAREQLATMMRSFLGALEARFDFKFALVSADSKNATVGLHMPPWFFEHGYEQISASPVSSAVLEYFAILICPASASRLLINGDRRVCGRDYSGSLLDLGPGRADIDFYAARGKLDAIHFFRPEAFHTVIFVADENQKVIGEKEFSEALALQRPETPTSVFAFTGFENRPGSCVIASAGTALANLAYATGGEAYDICQSTWEASVQRLLQNIMQSAPARPRTRHTAAPQSPATH